MDFERFGRSTKDKQEHAAMTPSQADNETLPIPNSIEDLFNNQLDIIKITTLDLSGCNLIDLPSSLRLPNLRKFSLAHNRLHKVPVCFFTTLDDLESLDLSYNRLEDFDMEPQCITKLTSLNLSFNKFDNIPNWILMFKAVNVEELNFSCNKSSHYNHLNSCNIVKCRMVKLNLASSCLIDKDYKFLKCFKNLEYLDISNVNDRHINIFHDIDNLFIKLVWNQLHVLKMNNLSLAIFPEGIAWVESLVELYLNYNHITWLPKGIQYLVNLKILDISHNDLVALPEEILKLELLNTIKAHWNRIDVIPNLTSLNKLTYLDLYENRLEQVPFQFENLKLLDLEQNYLNTSELSNSEKYFVLKRNLRGTVSDIREDGCLFETSLRCFHDEYAKSDISQTDDEFETRSFVTSIIEEDWDAPEIQYKNPEVDSADDEYDLDVYWCNYRKNCIKMKKVYVADEDWMFEDVD